MLPKLVTHNRLYWQNFWQFFWQHFLNIIYFHPRNFGAGYVKGIEINKLLLRNFV